jgi:LexA-binding, inner membrane-associated putative hydrolase
MSPVTHFFAGWMLASAFPSKQPTSLTRREKILVVGAALVPDLDGAGIIPELLSRSTSHPLPWFSEYHHTLHTLSFALLCTVAASFVVWSRRSQGTNPGRCAPTASRACLIATLVFVSFHLHLLCDLVGARGPDGYQWPIPYLRPFSSALQLSWHGQWFLNGWQNFLITAMLLATSLWIGWKYASTPLELASVRANEAFVHTLRRRFSPNTAGAE